MSYIAVAANTSNLLYILSGRKLRVHTTHGVIFCIKRKKKKNRLHDLFSHLLYRAKKNASIAALLLIGGL